MNSLYYGDNLNILRDYIKDESVDLIYLDPPFNSNRNYNVLFKNEAGSESESQITAFEDTWHWNQQAEQTYHELINEPDQVGRMIESFRSFIGQNQMMAYLTMMAVRLKELHRVLKPTGSLYLHCDPTASHYLKILLDTIFSAENFRNEIVWPRHNARSTDGRWPRVHDILFFYSKSKTFVYKDTQIPGSLHKIPHTLITGADGQKYQTYELTAPGVTRDGNSGLAWRGFDPSAMGRHWANNHDVMDQWDKDGLIHWPQRNGFPRRKASEPFVAGDRLVTVGDVWSDIDRINQAAKERLGYPTQKPVALLERIVSASSNEGDVVLDPFCGCGTTIAAAQKLNRQWIGIDITHLSVGLQKLRLKDSFGLTGITDAQWKKLDDEQRETHFVVEGQPTSLGGAKELAENDRYGFQWWILPLIGARAFGAEKGSKVGKHGADGGIDGLIVFTDDTSAKAKRVIVSVKSGHPNVTHIRDLGHVIDRENAAIGIYLTLEPPTKPMIAEAVGKGFYHSEGWNTDYPRIQILTVEDILAGKQPDLPPNLQTFRQAGRVSTESKEQGNLGFGG
ncbi:site-specific DNA-methyltransferase [soil metagenome]